MRLTAGPRACRVMIDAMEYRQATEADVQAMAGLFAAAHHDALTERQRGEQGFVQGNLDAAALCAMGRRRKPPARGRRAGRGVPRPGRTRGPARPAASGQGSARCPGLVAVAGPPAECGALAPVRPGTGRPRLPGAGCGTWTVHTGRRDGLRTGGRTHLRCGGGAGPGTVRHRLNTVNRGQARIFALACSNSASLMAPFSFRSASLARSSTWPLPPPPVVPTVWRT